MFRYSSEFSEYISDFSKKGLLRTLSILIYEPKTRFRK